MSSLFTHAGDAALWGGRLYWLAIPMAGVLATYAWRFLGVILVARIDPRGGLLAWVRAVATALVAALVARMVLFPAGLLAETSILARVLGLAAGLVFWRLSGGRLAAAVGLAAGTFLLMQLVLAP
jgi:hypothetical protein